MWNEEFKYLNKEKLQKQEKEVRKSIEISKYINEFILELEKLGNKKVTKKIEDLAKDFFQKKDIEVENIFYQNADRSYTGVNEKYRDRTLIITFNNYYGNYGNIEIMRGYENDVMGGFYNNLLYLNPCYQKENIEERENRVNVEFENAYKNIDLYNKKLAELVKLRDSFGFLAK